MGAMHIQTGPACLSMVLRHHGIDTSAQRVMTQFAIGDEGVGASLMVRMAQTFGLKARLTKMGGAALARLGEAYPVLMRLSNGNWVVLLGTEQPQPGTTLLRLYDPIAEGPGATIGIELDQFIKHWSGELVLAKRSFSMADPEQPFGFLWFVPEILQQRRLFADVAVAALFLYALGLATPIFFQLVIDKVLVHESYSTLVVLALGIGVATIFEALFVFLRR
ncbi:MAG: peptidase domain-containing ABC transporter, partial [Proteobacteria bacterium]